MERRRWIKVIIFQGRTDIQRFNNIEIVGKQNTKDDF